MKAKDKKGKKAERLRTYAKEYYHKHRNKLRNMVSKDEATPKEISLLRDFFKAHCSMPTKACAALRDYYKDLKVFLKKEKKELKLSQKK